ncbi:4-hydroxybenzoate octaprenyltransferase [Salmonella enterica subsp. enterica]|uniref:4-hydroxybenzoate octaprenyltransferase n=1 Tax=Salmonella enterica I TaxID=59201 RepID=A0A447TPV3_SALET|nr:4-hydroxybenzoate octaprenyltransferase [Salmonella enterica subsp. enterica]
MEWSLTQSKLLAFHRLMRTDKPIGALLLLWPTLWGTMGGDAGYASAVDFGGFCRWRVVNARGGLRGK